MKLFFILFTTSSSLIGQSWLQLMDYPDLGRDDGVAITVNNIGFFGTGLKTGYSLGNDFYAFDPSSNTWSIVTYLPSSAARQYACAFAGPNSFFVFSGSSTNGTLPDLYKYDLATNTWSTMASKPGNGVEGASCFEFGDKIIIAGGKNQGVVTDEVWEYTISSNTWLQKNNCPVGGRFRAGATVYNNTGYQIFGNDNNASFRHDLCSYNPTTDSWTTLANPPQTRARAYATLKAINAQLILFGGVDSLNTYYKDVWYFDPATAGWLQSTDFISFARKGGMSTVITNRFYYSCGIDVTNTREKETWVLDLPLGTEEYQYAPSFSIYPNPSNGNFVLKAGAGADIRIIDETGQTVRQFSLPESNSQLSVSGLANGIYILVAEKNGSVVTKKLIANR